MLTLVNSVDTQGAILAVLTARKNPFILSLVAKAGVTDVARFVLDRFETTECAQNEMYHYFGRVKSYDPDAAYTRVDDKVLYMMRVAEIVFGECAFSVVVEKMEV